VSNISKQLIVPYSANQMFDLVVNIEHYPSFLPWCGGAQVFKKTDHELDGTITIAYKGLSQSFRTHNHHEHPTRMTMNLVDGPFTHFCGQWQFTDIAGGGCQVHFKLDYAFKNFLLKMTVGSVFETIAKTLIDSFVQEAHKRYRV
jgi:ribosome-associated toxin RatA of RatAB toxin-antitoxin module